MGRVGGDQLLIRAKKWASEVLNRKYHIAVGYKSKSCLIYGGIHPGGGHQFVVFNPDQNLTTVYKQKTGGEPRKRSGHVGIYTALKASVLPSVGATAGADEIVGGLLVCGGWGGRDHGILVNDFWFLDSVTFTWHVPVFKGDVPHSLNLGVISQWAASRLILYRGGDGLHHNSDLWILNTDTGYWKAITARGDTWPPERTGPAGCVVPHVGFLIGGGWNASGILHDWWLYSKHEERWFTINAPNAGRRTGARLLYLKFLDSVLLIGGKSPEDCAPLMIASVEELESRHALDFRELTCIEGTVAGMVGHDACLIDDDTVLIIGGVDVVHREPISGATIITFDSNSGFSASPETDYIFTRPMGCFDANGLIQYSSSVNLADVEFETSGKPIPAHRVILAGRSSYFQTAFGFAHEGQQRMRLQASSYVHPCCFELFVASFYSLHLPTCLLVTKFTSDWTAGYPETDRQAMALLLWYVSANNYHHVITCQRNPVLPFPARTVQDTISCMLVLAQLADEYLYDNLANYIEVYLACLATQTSAQQLLKSSTAFGYTRLRTYIENAYQCEYVPLKKPAAPLLYESGGLPDVEAADPLVINDDDESTARLSSPTALPRLKERDYGSGRDPGRL